VSVLPVEIAGVRIDLCAAGPVSWEPSDPFVRPAGRVGPAAWSIHLSPGPLAGLGRVTGRLATRAGRWHLEGAEHLGWIDPASGQGEVTATPGLRLVSTLLRAAVARSVLARGGILLHAAAVLVDGRAHLFPARSGSGKSTLAARAGHALADEVVAVLPGTGGFVVHATPWWTSKGGHAPLAGVYAVAWDGEGITPLARAGALRRLVTNLVLPHDGPEDRARALEAAARIAAHVLFARFAFRPETDVDALLRGPALARTA
jgi:hypothetical protein